MVGEGGGQEESEGTGLKEEEKWKRKVRRGGRRKREKTKEKWCDQRGEVKGGRKIRVKRGLRVASKREEDWREGRELKEGEYGGEEVAEVVRLQELQKQKRTMEL
jgi:hypothetical protein